MQHKSFHPNTREFQGEIYHVAQRHTHANDANPGTASQPFKTIAQAASVADMGDVIIIGAGTYRETIPILRHGQLMVPSSMLTFKAAPLQRVCIKGSVVFTPAWRALPDGLFSAALPDALFQTGAYNPYALSAVLGDDTPARPYPGTDLPETRGGLYVNGQPLRQLGAAAALRKTANSFVVSADGRYLLVRFHRAAIPSGLIELVVRRDCFTAPGDGPLMIQVMGVEVVHAAEPGAFCRGAALAIRRHPAAGITVRKTPHLFGAGEHTVHLMGFPAYTGARRGIMRAACADNTAPGFQQAVRWYVAESADAGRTWRPVKQPAEADPALQGHYFLDEETGMLVRHYQRNMSDADLLGGLGKRRHVIMIQYSCNAGKSWTAPEVVDCGTYNHRIIRLQNGELLWALQEWSPAGRLRGAVRIGRRRDTAIGFDWQPGGAMEAGPEMTRHGPCEPSLAQFNDGRVCAILRQQGQVAPSEPGTGYPAVKFITTSNDNGRHWAPLAPLRYDDGRLVYSPSSWPEVIKSARTGRVYTILNIADTTVTGCDPRQTLHIAELDQDRLCLLRHTMALVEARHPQHHPLVRFSNWTVIDERGAGNWLLFMQLHMSEYCPVRYGYDWSSYRYEITLPSS